MLSLLVTVASAYALVMPTMPSHRPIAVSMQADGVGGSTKDRIEQMIADNKVMLFMKGTKMFPQCGFSNTAVMILKSITPEFETFDCLSDNEIREGIKEYSNWPTIPQCYIDGEFIGGCDLLIEMYQNGELQEEIEKAVAS